MVDHQGKPSLHYRARTWVSKIAYRIHALGVERGDLHRNIRNLQDDLKTGRLHRTGYVDHYSGEEELKVWRRYQASYAAGEQSEVQYRASYVRDRLRELPIKSMVNFGCSYGWLEGQMSETIGAYGVDRSEEAMRLNRAEFPNAYFCAKDIFDFLAQRQVDALCHINIGVYFLPTFIAKLYAAAQAAGVRYIVAWEPSGISRQTNRYFGYSEEPRESVVFRGPMILNNYPNLMKQAGYSIVHAKALKPPHPEPDFRSVCFIASRPETGT
jgi:SAM-dependent methyltransferase